jgi:hypothetical protein
LITEFWNDAVTEVGGSGIDTGITWFEKAGLEEPKPVVAVTDAVYDVPFVRPEKDADVSVTI